MWNFFKKRRHQNNVKPPEGVAIIIFSHFLSISSTPSQVKKCIQLLSPSILNYPLPYLILPYPTLPPCSRVESHKPTAQAEWVPPPVSAGGRGAWELSLITSFQKWGLDRILTFRGGLLERGRWIFQWGLQFLYKLKSEIFNNN